jgi:hypothetical protein
VLFATQGALGASGLMRSAAYDASVFRDTKHEQPQFPWELNIGDGHCSTCANFFTSTQAIGGRQLSTQEATWHEWLQCMRLRVEHLSTVVKNHRMFKGESFRGWLRNLKVLVKISTHGAAVQLRASAAQVKLILSPKQRAKPKTSARKTDRSMPHCVARWVWLLRVLRSGGE